MGHGIRVDVDIIMFQERVPQLPLGAFFRVGEDWVVYAIKNRRAVLRKVGVGQRNGLAVEVLKGIGEGQPVVLYPGSQVEDQTAVKPRETSAW